MIGLVIVVVMVFIAVFAPVLAPYDPDEIHPLDAFRNLFQKVIFSEQTSSVVIFCPV